MTLTLPFLPSIVATAMERKCKTFIKHLPVAQLWTHQEMLRRITTLQNDIGQWEALLTRLKDDNSMNKQLVDDIRKCIVDVENLQAEKKQFWINWKKNLLKAGNIEAGHTGIKWYNVNVDDETLWDTWKQNCNNLRHDPKRMIQLFKNMIENYNIAKKQKPTIENSKDTRTNKRCDKSQCDKVFTLSKSFSVLPFGPAIYPRVHECIE